MSANNRLPMKRISMPLTSLRISLLSQPQTLLSSISRLSTSPHRQRSWSSPQRASFNWENCLPKHTYNTGKSAENAFKMEQVKQIVAMDVFGNADVVGLRAILSDFTLGIRAQRQPQEPAPHAALLSASLFSMASDVGVIERPPRAVHRSSRGICWATRFAVSMTSSNGMTWS